MIRPESGNVVISGEIASGMEDAISEVSLSIETLMFVQNPVRAFATGVWSGNFAASVGLDGDRYKLISNGIDAPVDTDYATAINTNASDTYSLNLWRYSSISGSILRKATKAEIRARCRRTDVGSPAFYVGMEGDVGTTIFSQTWVPMSTVNEWEDLLLWKDELDFSGITEAWPSVYITVSLTGNEADTFDISELELKIML